MATLADVIKKRRSTGQSRTGSLLGSLKDKFKEAIDPRKFLNQTGILTALFPSLKAYKVNATSSDVIDSLTKNLINQNYNNPSLIKIQKNTEISAKNSLVLPAISRDVNVLKQNMIKLVKISGVTPATKADMFFLKQSENAKMYESILSKRDTPEKIERVENKKKSFNFVKFLSVIGSGIVSLLLFDFLFRKKDSVVYKIYDGIKTKLEEWKSSIQLYISNLFDDFGDAMNKMMKGVNEALDESFDELNQAISVEGIIDLLKSGETPIEKLDKILASAKQKASDAINGFSLIPEAKAAIMPSMFTGLEGVDPDKINMNIKGSAEEAMNFFMSRGWTKEQAAGIVGNLIQESNLNPTAVNTKENAQGLAQWTPVGGRQQMIAKHLGKPIVEASFREQLDAIDWELKNKETKAGSLLKQSKTASEAAFVVDKFYERSRGTELRDRIKYSNSLMGIPVTPDAGQIASTDLNPSLEKPEEILGKILEEQSALQISQESIPERILDTLVYHKSDNRVAVIQKDSVRGMLVDPIDSMVSFVT